MENLTINDNCKASLQSIEELTNDYIGNLLAAQELGQEFMFQTLMDFGNLLGGYPEIEKTEDNLIHGCQSTVYISAGIIDDRIFYKGFADSKLVQGQVAILLKILDGQKSDDIINHSKEYLEMFVNSTNIISSLSPSRQNAFGSMFEHIRKKAVLLSERK